MRLTNFKLRANRAVGIETPLFFTCVGYTDESVFNAESLKKLVQTFSERRQ